MRFVKKNMTYTEEHAGASLLIPMILVLHHKLLIHNICFVFLEENYLRS